MKRKCIELELQYDLNNDPMWETNKKSKEHTTDQTIDLDILVDRVIRWLHKNENNQPETQQEFLNCLHQFHLCRITVKVDVKIIFYHLLFNHIVLIDDKNQIFRNPHYDPKIPLKGFVPLDSDRQIFSYDFTKALRGSIQWVQGSPSTSEPSPFDRFFIDLENCCMFLREAHPAAILAQLEKRQYITMSVDGHMEYHLPSLRDSLIYQGDHIPS